MSESFHPSWVEIANLWHVNLRKGFLRVLQQCALYRLVKYSVMHDPCSLYIIIIMLCICADQFLHVECN